MKFWIFVRYTGWTLSVAGYVYAVIRIYRTIDQQARASVAGSKTYVSADCVSNCLQQKTISQTSVVSLTLAAAVVLLVVMGGIYMYMKPSLDRITELRSK
jgi:hypothetical protein